MVRVSSKVRAGLIVGAMCAYMAPTAFAQDTNVNEQAYHVLLQEIADKKISIAQQQVFVAGAKTQIADLSAQLEGLDDIKVGVAPMIDKMVAAIGREIAADLPFKKDERLARYNRLKNLVADDKASVGEKYRNALNVYKIEVNYGQSLEAYKGNHPKTPTIREGDDRFEKEDDGSIKISKKTGQPVEAFDGDYLRYGRAALVYVNADGSDPLRYDLETGDWVALKGAGADVRRAIRISYGEVAPGVVMAPVVQMP